MSLNKLWHVAAFAGCLGLVVYLANGLWSAFVAVDLPHEPGAVVDYVEFEHEGESGRYTPHTMTEAVPVRFSSTLEELKYHHNVGMHERNRYRIYGTMAFGALAGILAFALIPRWRGLRYHADYAGGAASWIVGAWIGAFFALVVPVVLGWVLPAPADLFPRQIREAADQRRAEALAVLEQQAAIMGSFDSQ